MHTNCDCGGKQNRSSAGHTCGCDRFGGHTLRANLADEVTRRVQYEGRDTLVVPVIMARADVVMNGTLVPFEEFFPEAWNGVPVTVGHPETASGSTTANDPQIMTDWAVGRIYNSHVNDGALKAEAWIDVVRAENLSPGLIANLEAGNPMDVSTGYFSKDVQVRGQTNNGQHYSTISRNLDPDHLALLPGAVGACSWEDGCGVRTNQENGMADGPKQNKIRDLVTKFTDSLVTALDFTDPDTGHRPSPGQQLRANARGEDDDYRMMIADLISDNRSPFMPADMDSLNMMSMATLTTLRDQYLPAKPSKSKKDNADMALTEEDKKALALNAKEQAQQVLKDSGLPQSAEELTTLVTNAVTAGVTAALKDGGALSAEDKAALAGAKQVQEDHKNGVVAHIVANSAMTKEQLDPMPIATLETIKAGLLPAPDFSGRGFPSRDLNINAAAEDDAAVAAMTPPNVRELIINRANSKKEAN